MGEDKVWVAGPTRAACCTRRGMHKRMRGIKVHEMRKEDEDQGQQTGPPTAAAFVSRGRQEGECFAASNISWCAEEVTSR
eukprot:1139763-Pelagomonas_calceolata.AAC.4